MTLEPHTCSVSCEDAGAGQVNVAPASVHQMAGLGGLTPPQQEAHEDAHTRTQDGHGKPEASHAPRCVACLEVTYGPVAHVWVQRLGGGGQGAALDGHELAEGENTEKTGS